MPLTLEFGVNTFLWHLKFSTLGDSDRFGWLVAGTFGHVLDLVNNLIAFKHLAEDDMTPIKPAEQICQYNQLDAATQALTS